MARDTLGQFEHQVLSVLMKQKQEDSYGVRIGETIKVLTGREPSVGALYTTLERLEVKGFVSSNWGEATPERGGRRKRLYRIEANGRKAVMATDAARNAVAGFLTPQEA